MNDRGRGGNGIEHAARERSDGLGIREQGGQRGAESGRVLRSRARQRGEGRRRVALGRGSGKEMPGASRRAGGNGSSTRWSLLEKKNLRRGAQQGLSLEERALGGMGKSWMETGGQRRKSDGATLLGRVGGTAGEMGGGAAGCREKVGARWAAARTRRTDAHNAGRARASCSCDGLRGGGGFRS